LRLQLREFPDGVEVDGGNAVLYDVASNTATFGGGTANGHALTWTVAEDEDPGAKLDAAVELDPSTGWVMRCDRVDFPPGGVAHTHTHPGPGIRCLLNGEIRIETEGRTETYGPFEAWFEAGPEPVFAAASESEDTGFVRVLLLPSEYAGQRTIRYVDPADAEKPKTQQATILLEEPLEL
jgi:quercetin dioxygenase-like cupin family protein